jgi:hypothetical protein
LIIAELSSIGKDLVRQLVLISFHLGVLLFFCDVALVAKQFVGTSFLGFTNLP